jgi:hypothetical protein
MSEHWYSRDGIPCHVQPTKSKTAKNPTRPTNIKDAIAQNLLPSVSAITRMLAAPGLVNWQLGEVAKACFNAPPIAGEEMEEYVRNMVAKSKEGTGAAADLGTAIHAGIEAELTGKPWDDYELDGTRISLYVDAALVRLKSLGITVEAAERVLVNPWDGYAGTTDIVFTKGDHCGILDFKSKRTKPGVPVTPSETHSMQIAAYLAANWKKEKTAAAIKPNMYGVNMYISTTEPGRVEVVEYSYADLLAAWEDFQACAHLWRSQNAYDPRIT